MPYIKRNTEGEIVAVSRAGSTEFSEEVSADDGQLVSFLAQMKAVERSLDSTDQDFIRVLEDLVEVLIGKGVILFTDLPDSAQEKMMQRQRMRSEIHEKLNLIGDD